MIESPANNITKKQSYNIVCKPGPLTQTHPRSQCLLLQTLLYKLTDASRHCLWHGLSMGVVLDELCKCSGHVWNNGTVGGKIMSHEKKILEEMQKTTFKAYRVLAQKPIQSYQQRLRFFCISWPWTWVSPIWLTSWDNIHEMFPIFNHYLTTEINQPREPGAAMHGFLCDMRLVRRPQIGDQGQWFSAFRKELQQLIPPKKIQKYPKIDLVFEAWSWCCVHDIHGLMIWLLRYTIRCITYSIMSVHMIIKHMHQNN